MLVFISGQIYYRVVRWHRVKGTQFQAPFVDRWRHSNFQRRSSFSARYSHMSISLMPSGFYEWGAPPKGTLGVHTERLEECLAYFHERGFHGLFGHESFGFKQDNLDFLSQATNAKSLWFWDIALRDIDGVYELTELDHVGIHPKRPGIDFSRFPVLKTAINHWHKADTGISASTITEYYLWHYKPKSKSFEGLEIPQNTKRLELTWANVTSLEGLPVLKKLKELQLHRCRNLTDLSALPRIAPNLTKLLTTTSSKLDVTAGVIDHPKLKMALIDGKYAVGSGD